MTDTFSIFGDDVASEEFDGDLVVLNLQSGLYFGFNASASEIWKAIMAGIGLSELKATGVSDENLTAFIAELEKHELVKRSVEVARDPSYSLSGSVASEPPTVEVFADLADLIMADPIHDVDEEAGWPHVPKA